MTKTKLSIDVGIPLFNPGPEFARTLESILSQTRMPNKLIVIDDCSNIDPRPFFNDLPMELDYSKNNQNRGICWNFSDLVKKSSADYFVFLAQDDYWDNTFLEKLENALLACKNACVAVPGIRHIFENFEIEEYLPTNEDYQIITEKTFLNDFFSGKRINNAIYYGLWRRCHLSYIYEIIEKFNFESNEKFPVMLGYLSGEFIGVSKVLFYKSHLRRTGVRKLGGTLSIYSYWQHINLARKMQETIIYEFKCEYPQRKLQLIKKIRQLNWRKIFRRLLTDNLFRLLSSFVKLFNERYKREKKGISLK